MLHTGQHWDPELSEVFFEELGLPQPRYRLDLHTADAGAMRPGIARRSSVERPDWALVFGDTNSTLAGTEAAADAGVPVAHVEAGLRSGDLSMPEERNRIAVDAVAGAPALPRRALARDAARARACAGRIEVVGDVMADACFRSRADRARALDRAAAATSSSPAATSRRRSTARRTCGPTGCAASSTGSAGIGEPRRLPAPTRARARRSASSGRCRRTSRSSPRSATSTSAALVSQARVLVTDSGGLAEGGVLVRRAVRHRAAVDRVDGHRRARRERARRRRPGAPRRGRRGGAACPPELPPLYGDGHAAERVVASLAAG